MASTAAVAYGLDHAPKFTINALHALLFAAFSDYQEQAEQKKFVDQFMGLMAARGPWQYGPEAALLSRAALDRLPASTRSITLLDPYYFDHSMVFTDDSCRDGGAQLFAYAYRLHPCGVFALNYDPRQKDNDLLVGSVICSAYFIGTDLWGKPLLLYATWQEGLPLGSGCAFDMPRWGFLRKAEEYGEGSVARTFLMNIGRLANATGGATSAEIDVVMRRIDGTEKLPTPVERGFPNLADTIWFGSEPFPALENFEQALIGADFQQRKESIPLWFRAARGELG